MKNQSAADLAAAATLLQIGAELGLDHVLEPGNPFTIASAAETAGIPRSGVAAYVETLAAAGLVVPTADPGVFCAAPDFAERRHEAGYLAWSLTANSPFVENAREFLIDRETSAQAHQRNGRRVAVSSRWIGERTFYPAVLNRTRASGASRIVDLGAGAGGLLIQALQQDSSRTGVAVDISASACSSARTAAIRAGVAERMEVVERPIESLIDDPGPIKGADVITACFVLHDIVQDDALCEAVLRQCRDALPPGGAMVVADAVSFAAGEEERRFSALFTYLHATFMEVFLPSEKEWLEKFRAAGFRHVESHAEILPGGRLFVAVR
ncbi:methyltransferase [Micromonospora sp. WMMC273]|uniref:methyltransferase n=1 Tax=Micromonospora sp. WMMC273 TaxID=3015157 RepID=UPI0022B61B5C|nr:methyltransferase [Micromonospora sp. WMMC273]MCZ7476273.1 methyltransferase [Micromonospora sp. WMMC273]